MSELIRFNLHLFVQLKILLNREREREKCVKKITKQIYRIHKLSATGAQQIFNL